MATGKTQALRDMASTAEDVLVEAAINPKTTDVAKEISDLKVAVTQTAIAEVQEFNDYQVTLLEVWAEQQAALGVDMSFVRDRIDMLRSGGRT